MGMRSEFITQPLYLQLRDALAQRIAAKEWRPGTILPNEDNLAREYGVSLGTMRKALAILKQELLITRRRGWGTFVNDPSRGPQASRFSNIRSAEGSLLNGTVSRSVLSIGEANEAECSRLRLAPSALAYRIHRVHQDQGRPFLVEDAVVPADLFPRLEESNNPSREIVALAHEYGILPGPGEERVSVSCAAASVAKSLAISAGLAILVLDRLVLTADGSPLEWRMAYCHLADKQYVTRMY